MNSEFWDQDTYQRTYCFAAEAHQGQLVPGTEISYLMHLSLVTIEVVAALRHEPGRDENFAVQCALLHDVIEDTNVTYSEVNDVFGPSVADGVLALTKSDALEKSASMADSLNRIHLQPREVWMVKLADRITNLQPPPHYWTNEKRSVYRAEARVILSSLGDASPYLAQRLQAKIDDYASYLTG